MNKNKFILFFLVCANLLFAQIAIDSAGVDRYAVVDIATENKAVLFPRVSNIFSEQDLSFFKVNQPEGVPAGLLVYNNSLLRSSLVRGHYYWDNGTWSQLVDDESVFSKLEIDKVNNTQTSEASYIKEFFANNVTPPNGEFNDNLIVENSFKWVELVGLDYTFEIKNRNHSNVFVKVSGVGQYAPSEYTNLILGMNLGVFLQRIDEEDDRFKLQGMSTTRLNNILNSNCHLFSYGLQVPIGELPIGKYRIKSYVSGERNFENNKDIIDKWITVGGKSLSENGSSNTDCPNSNNDQLIARQTVVVTITEN